MDELKNMDLFTLQLQSLWSAESMLVEAMPRMIKKASNLGLKKSLAHHLAETDQHKVAIEAICKGLNIDPKGGEPNAELQNILLQGEKAMIGKVSGDDLDAAIITSAQEIEQFEITAYSPVAESARALGYEGIAKRLYLTLEEERQAENKLKFLEKNLYSEKAEIGQQETVKMSERNRRVSIY